MANVKDNRRARFTRESLRRSLLTLMLQKPVDRITVKELCAAADINRGTFYAHYSSPEQLLAQIENEFYLDLLTEVATFQQADDVERIFTKALYALRDRMELASVLFGPNGDRAFLARVINVAHDMCIVQWSAVSPEAGRDELEHLYTFIAYGVVRTLQKWLSGGAAESPEYMAALLTDLCNFGVGGFVDLSQVQPPVDRRFRRFKEGEGTGE